MKNKTTKTPAGHDDVSGLFARLGGQASEGYHDFAYTQLAPRAAGNSAESDVDATKAAAPAATVAQAATPAPAPAPAIAQTPVMHVAPAALSAVPAVMAPEAPHADAAAPLRKLRQPDAPAVRAVPAEPVQAGTPLQQLFQRLLQTDAPAATHSSPLKRLRWR
ncbi:hypothetical protein VDF98_08495 [Xanthomonas campestris pv. raphani]|uniref:hypothetical protein n=1 Tax=Xanthomonas campestris TaxID=339 RepID=UPI002367B1DD|nr:hypothetical protein [Xanthomonas campestris]MEA9823453.1 hypothetical protein [Xanthomonas campestris pv. raphani]MEA9851776.1 hypothetical protein [Xanthomonas campestris pv. raphani]MEA9855999.1 hypothetical protein [Xanthomonas campestris pv. raphani]MEA9964826.1 hypothetical protein [Xanthomonas campestris pv. raphani]WDJ21789.1 hypothetical protein JH270_18415 [Xanthomonas campestris pv. raphani]